MVKRFFIDNGKKLLISLEHSTLKLEKKKSHFIFNETCYNNDILSNNTKINYYPIDPMPMLSQRNS